jgi:hypothetical protein
MIGTYLIDGTDIRIAGTRLLRNVDGLYTMGGVRGDDLTVVDADGSTWLDERPFDPFTLPLPLTLRGGSEAGFNDLLRTLRRLVKPDRTFTLTRRLSFGSGTEDHTALARYVDGLPPQMAPGIVEGDLTLNLRNLDGIWYGPTATVTTGSVTILGDVRTHRMTITFTGGTNPTLTNSTTGDSLTWTGTVGGTPVVVDVEAMTATQGVTDVSGALVWNRTYPMTFRAGSNTLAVTGGGTVSTAYAPAYQ